MSKKNWPALAEKKMLLQLVDASSGSRLTLLTCAERVGLDAQLFARVAPLAAATKHNVRILSEPPPQSAPFDRMHLRRVEWPPSRGAIAKADGARRGAITRRRAARTAPCTRID